MVVLLLLGADFSVLHPQEWVTVRYRKGPLSQMAAIAM